MTDSYGGIDLEIEEIFNDINHKIFETEHVDLQHLYIDGSKFEANANKYTWVWKKATEKSRYRLFDKITALFQEINEELAYTVMKHMWKSGSLMKLSSNKAGAIIRQSSSAIMRS